MLIIPAIDLQEGCVVRYVQGRSNKKIYSRDPVKTAKHWVQQGAQFLHIVDLDGATTGSLKNLPVVKAIAKQVAVPFEFGGGIRNITSIELLLEAGAKRVIIGTRAIEDEGFLKKVFKRFGDRILVSIDAQQGKLMVKGWRVPTRRKTDDFASMLKSIGFRQFIYTDTSKDGTLKGPNIKELKGLLKVSAMNIIASGGISCLDDIFRLRLLEPKGVSAVIIGKALYEGRFTLPQAIKTGK